MKKILPIIVIILAAIGIGYNFIGRGVPSTPTGTDTGFPTPSAEQTISSSGEVAAPIDNTLAPGLEGTAGDDAGVIDEVKPASVAYQNADEALNAIKKGAGDYDDSILEQFTTPGEDCTFCDQLYTDLKSLVNSSSAKNEEKAYYAEILAISGRVDNVKALVEGFKNASTTENKELFSAALELTTGKEDVVKYLGDELKTDNPDLKESLVAAMTNQGGSTAFETLFQNIVDSKNSDGYYSMGIGPAEMILDEQGLTKAKEYAMKRDEYSPLAIKAMLNSGLQGLKSVIDILESSNDDASNDKLIQGAIDHIGYDEQTEKYLKEKANSSNPKVRQLAEDTLRDYANQEEELNQEPTDEAPMSKMNP
jgi:spore coat protein CotF